MEIVDFIRKLCKENGIAISKLEQKLGYGNQSLTKGKNIPFYRVVEIANYFDIPISAFVDTPQDAHGFSATDEEKEIIRKYRAVDDTTQGIIRDILHIERKEETTEKGERKRA